MRRLILVTVILLAQAGCGPGAGVDTGALEPAARDQAGTFPALQPWPENPRYWAYRGRPTLLLGGSPDDNLFQIPNLKEHLDQLGAAGGNYVRNTMSDRRERGFEVYPFARLDDGRFDLARWNPEYWKRLDALLELTAARGMVVQIEVWDRFDYAGAAWLAHPYNPANNINYSAAESGLAPRYPQPAWENANPFFETPPQLDNNLTVRRFQQRFVDELLRRTLRHDHILYCIDNETSGMPAWSAYWAGHIRRRAAAANRRVFITEMWDDWNITGDQHRHTLERRDLYDYADVSQNNHLHGDRHWDRFQTIRQRLAPRPYPLNAVKTYGKDGGPFGSTRDGLERWWRHLIGGAAAVRFHRGGSGLGLSAPAARSIMAAREIEARVRLWEMEPANHLLHGRQPNEAFATADPGRAYAVYFPDGGRIELDLRDAADPFDVVWIDVLGGRRVRQAVAAGVTKTRLAAPSSGHWVALLTAR
ncbi:MAG: hypothetical protein RIC56_22830 [Pseudomonadales bacterium]